MIIKFIKENIRLIKYKFRLSKYQKPNYQLDSSFPLVKKIRESGVGIIENFKGENDCALKLIDHFQKFIKSDVNEKINEANIENKTHKSFYKFKITSLFNDQDLLKLADDKFILSNITQYFGFKPYLREINVSVDYKYKNEADSPKFTQLFHRDPDDLKLIKVFFYLNDVNNENGPFQYVLKSHLKPWKDVEYYHNENSKRNSEKEIYTAIGKKGTMIFADTNGLHRGLVLKEKFRVMLTLMYTSNKPITGKLEKVISD